jgi:hypothetical protein
MASTIHKDYPSPLKDFIQGQTIPIVITRKVNGVVSDVTGYKGYVYFSKERNGGGDDDIEIELNPTATPTDGILSGELTDTQTLAMDATTWYYSFRYINPSGQTFVPFIGKVKILEGINPRIEQ